MDSDEIQEFRVAHKRRYSKNHLWYQEKDDRITIGVTDFISQEKGEVLRVVLPHAGNEVYVDEELFSIDFEEGTLVFRSYFSGEIIEVNGEVEINPELVEPADGCESPPYRHHVPARCGKVKFVPELETGIVKLLCVTLRIEEVDDRVV